MTIKAMIVIGVDIISGRAIAPWRSRPIARENHTTRCASRSSSKGRHAPVARQPIQRFGDLHIELTAVARIFDEFRAHT
jgi:hypothetical protein